MHYRLSPGAQVCRNSVPKVNWPIQQGCALCHPLYGSIWICVARLVESQARAVPAR
jgi:hypothetical protein